MFQWSRYVPRMWLTGLIALAALSTGCGDDEVAAPNKLCRNGAGFGARIAGNSKPVDMCVSDDQTTTTLGNVTPNRYDLFAVFAADSITFEINVSFITHTNLPRTLVITGDPNLPGPDDVWFFYRETKPGTYDYTSSSVSGVFTLTFSDPTVAVATFSSLLISLEDANAGGMTAGSRTISEGFVAVTPD